MAAPTRAASVDRSLDRTTTGSAPPRGEARIVDTAPSLDAICAGLRMDDGSAGAVVTFTGVVRADRLDDPHGQGGRQVTALEFECYPEMAGPELERVRAEALGRWPLAGLTLHHRTGRLAVGEDIVVVAAAAAHRKDAFAAAAWAMDEIKRRVPLWKREVADDGTTRWVPGDSCRCMDP